MPPDEVSRRFAEMYGTYDVEPARAARPIKAREIFGRPTVLLAIVWTFGSTIYLAYRMLFG